MSVSKAFDRLGKRDLETLKKGANLHIVVKNTLNSVAFDARTKAVKKTLDKKLIVRTQYTKSGVQYQKVPAGKLKIAQMQSAYGVDQKRSYLAKQETGFKMDSGTIPALSTRVGNNKRKRIKKNLYLNKLQIHLPVQKIITKLVMLDRSKQVKIGSNAAIYIDKKAQSVIKYDTGFYQFKDYASGAPRTNFRVMKQIYTPHKQDIKQGNRKPVHWMQSNNSRIKQSDFDKSFSKSLSNLTKNKR